MPSIFFYFSVFYEEKTFGEKICGKQTPKVFSLKHNYEERIILRFFFPSKQLTIDGLWVKELLLKAEEITMKQNH